LRKLGGGVLVKFVVSGLSLRVMMVTPSTANGTQVRPLPGRLGVPIGGSGYLALVFQGPLGGLLAASGQP
jgi:hypothetical protein